VQSILVVLVSDRGMGLGKYRLYEGNKKNAVFWDVTPRGSCKNQRFGGTYRLHHQGERISEVGITLRFEVFTAVTICRHLGCYAVWLL
jgi:Rieske Fe-S protein